MSATLAGLTTIIITQKLDIIFLQEVRLTSEQLDLLVGRLGFQSSVNIDIDNPSRPGTAIIWKKSLPVRDVFILVSCRAQLAVLGPYMLLNVYAPSGSDKKHERSVFYGQDLFQAMSLSPDAYWIIGGDFNCVLKSFDIEGGVGFTQKFCPSLKDLVRSQGLCDVFREKFPRREEFTFFRAGRAPSRLDKFFVSKRLGGSVSNVLHVASLSDHCGVQMGVRLEVKVMSLPREQRRTYWKLNTAILYEEEFLPNFVSFWRRISRQQLNFEDLAVWWDKVAKPEIKDFCVGFSIYRKRSRDNTKKFLLSYLKLVLAKKNWEEVARVKEKLGTMLKEDALGVIIRSRFKQNTEDEKASLYHAAREAKNDRNNVTSLRVDGKVIKDQQKIEEVVINFFGALFNGHHNADLVDTGVAFVPDNSFLGDFLENLGELSDTDRDKLHVDIAIEELDDVIKNCDNNKSPGLDGLPYEFYKVAWPVIREDFCSILQCQLDRFKLIESDTVGATRLAPKVSGVPQVDELRPITLLNTDYKILTKLFVLRMLPILVFIIRSGQLCTVGSKNILFGVSNILSSLLFIKQNNLGACLISLDFFKAYDRVMIDFLILVMKKMNFSDTFCKWIRMLHVGAKTRFILQFLSKAIEVNFSIRQGDPLAMLLYIIYIEPLLLYLERVLVGIRVARIPQCIEAYCDDVNILTNRMSDFLVLDEAVRKFEAVSGAILSREKKCKVLGFGTWKNEERWPLDYIKSVKEIKIFGIFVMDSYRGMIKKNWEFRFEKFQNIVKSWSPRILDTLNQRVEVLKMFALSRVYYVASILPIRKTMIKKFEKEMGNFVWRASGRVLRVPIGELVNAPEAGGLGLPCLQSMCSSLLLSQLLRMLDSGDRKSIGHVDYWLGEVLGDMVVGLGSDQYAEVLPEYFTQLEELVVNARTADLVSGNGWRTITNKIIYSEHAKNFQVPKMVRESGFGYEGVWKRLMKPVLPAVAKDILFLLVHNKLPVRERLFRIGLQVDPYCDLCPGGVFCDLEHFFCSCDKVVEVWDWVRRQLVQLLGGNSDGVSNWEFINLFWPGSRREKDLVWMIGIYVAKVWEEIYVRGKSRLRMEVFFGFLTFKYKSAQLGARLGMIPGLLG